MSHANLVTIRVRVFVGAREIPLEGTLLKSNGNPVGPKDKRDRLFITHMLIHEKSSIVETFRDNFLSRKKIRAQCGYIGRPAEDTGLPPGVVLVHERYGTPICGKDSPRSCDMNTDQDDDSDDGSPPLEPEVVCAYLPERQPSTKKWTHKDKPDVKALRLLAEIEKVLPLVSDETAAAAATALSRLQLCVSEAARNEFCRCPLVDKLPAAVMELYVLPRLDDNEVARLAPRVFTRAT